MACVISPIIKVTEMCNFDCVFCRYSNHKQNTGIMNVDIVKKILEESAEINAETNQKVKVLFHGGDRCYGELSVFTRFMNMRKNFQIRQVLSLLTVSRQMHH